MEAEDRLKEKDRGRLERLPRPLNLKNSGKRGGEEKGLMTVSAGSNNENHHRSLSEGTKKVQGQHLT